MNHWWKKGWFSTLSLKIIKYEKDFFNLYLIAQFKVIFKTSLLIVLDFFPLIFY